MAMRHNREAGVNPARSRHCIGGANAYMSLAHAGKACRCDDSLVRRPAAI